MNAHFKSHTYTVKTEAEKADSINLLDLVLENTEAAKAKTELKVEPVKVEAETPKVPAGFKLVPAGKSKLIRTSIEWAKGSKINGGKPHAVSINGGKSWRYFDEVEILGGAKLKVVKTCSGGRTTALETTAAVLVK